METQPSGKESESMDGLVEETKRAVETADRLRKARLLNGFKTERELIAVVGQRSAKVLLRAENEDRRLPTAATINLAADTYRVSTDYLFGRIDCPESEDDQLMRVGLIKSIEDKGGELIRFLGEQLGNVASDYLETVSPLGTGLLLQHAEEFIKMSATVDFTAPLRFKLNQMQISVTEIKEARNDRSQRIRARIASIQAKKAASPNA